jgi:hypothetical protein
LRVTTLDDDKEARDDKESRDSSVGRPPIRQMTPAHWVATASFVALGSFLIWRNEVGVWTAPTLISLAIAICTATGAIRPRDMIRLLRALKLR